MANLPTHLNMKTEHMLFGMMEIKIGVLDFLPYVGKKSGIAAFMLVAKFTLVAMMYVLQIKNMSGSTQMQIMNGSQQITASKLFLLINIDIKVSIIYHLLIVV